MPALAPYFVKKSLERLALSDAYREHALKLLELCEADQRINVQKIHAQLFPLSAPASANASLNRLLKIINDSAAKHGVPLKALITENKKAGAAQRWVWFEGPIDAPAGTYTGELNAIPAARLITDQRGIPANEPPTVILLTFNEHESAAVIRHFSGDAPPKTETRDGITYNLLGMHGDMRIVQRISRQGEGEAQNAAHDAIRSWQPRAIIGVGIAFGINPAKQTIGDVLVSENVRGYELGRINADGSFTLRSDKPPASPILLQRFNHLNQTCNATDTACLHWPTLRFGTLLSGNKLVDNLDYRNSLLKLESEAIGGEMEALGIQLAAGRRRIDWIIVKAVCDWGDGNKNSQSKERDQKLAADHAALVVQRALSLGNLYQDEPASVPRGATRPAALPPPVRHMNLRDRERIADGLLIDDQQGRYATLSKQAGEAAQPSDEAHGVDVLEYLLNWIADEQAPPLFALLGEYGMGKTVTCQRLAEHLETRRLADPTLALPLYFDLRHVTGLDRRVPTLRETLEECMARGWRDSGAATYTLENVIRWIEQGAVVIIDGLDEVLVKLKEHEGQTFTNGLLGLRGSVPRIKLLISCRTQYFRTLRDQQTHFTGQERGEHQAEAYRALILLPLGEAQIVRYLRGMLPDSDPQALLDLLRSVHNLEDLAHRPYTLKLVAEFIPHIERERLAGKTVYGVTLYRHMAQSWLERDQGKHHIRPEHKLRLAAHLAAHLWQSGDGLLPAGEIEAWFHAWLESRPELRRRYANLHPDQLEEDLRTATFLAREDGDHGSSFRFAHTSLLEFFLAEYLFQAVRDNTPQCWAVKQPSAETLDFLGQMFAESADPALIQTLQGWRAPYRAQCSELLLAYTASARNKGRPAPLLRGIALNGADLQEWVFEGNPGAGPLDMSGADFSGARLRGARFDHVRLAGANFSKAGLVQANFWDCDASNSDWREADCTAAVWRNTRLTGAQWAGATGYRPQFLDCVEIKAAVGFESEQRAPTSRAGKFPILCWLGRTEAVINCCAFSPDGKHLVSGGGDGVLRIWDARSGEKLLNLFGHEGWIGRCVFSPDGTRLLSGGSDGVLRIWDARSGKHLLCLFGHKGWIGSCAFSPDGMNVLSGGADGKLRIWDASSGEILLTLSVQEGWIGDCVFSTDGTRLLSSGEDGALHLWDASSGEILLSLSVPEQKIACCAFSPDGALLLSGDDGGVLRMWDANSGEMLQSICGHDVWIASCAFSSDGGRLLSCGYDGVLRLWGTWSGENLLCLHGDEFGLISCAFSPNGEYLLSGGDEGVLHLWDARSGEICLSMLGTDGGMACCSFSSDGGYLLSGGSDGVLRQWDSHSGELQIASEPHSGIRVCAFSPDGAYIISGGLDGVLRLWGTNFTGGYKKLIGHDDSINDCVFSPDGTGLLSGGEDGVLNLWHVESGKLVSQFHGHRGGIRSCAFSPDGVFLLSGYENGGLHLWDSRDGGVRLFINSDRWGANCCAFSPDGLRLLSGGGDGVLRLWDARSGAALSSLHAQDSWINSCVFSPDGMCILSGGRAGILRLWDVCSGETLLNLVGHESHINSCAFSPDGTRLLSAGADGTLRLWDAHTGGLLRIHAAAPSRSPFSASSHAVWEPETNRLIEASGEIWRDLAWVRTGADGWPERLPLETFGPLPAPQRLVEVHHAPLAARTPRRS